ncbi:unnamed protein product [Musa acuminata subsp. malaccensis]|uniref:(wild Malaysian banana) hypothetical protein n=1 Tax=Musa acuminata subsp. malaccensis TaxID=214687 RepID=A0A804K5Q4_MUSAM|nr:unnamed protein product [Musa acuminata subsp. malaccensis]
MASTTSVTCGLTSPALVDAKVTPRQTAPHSIGLPSLPPPPHIATPSRPQARETWTTAAYCKSFGSSIPCCFTHSESHINIAKQKNGIETNRLKEEQLNAFLWIFGGSGRKVAGKFIVRAAGESSAEVATELPEIVKKIQDAWDKLEDKYAISGLALVGAIALWSTGGMISAIDRLPVVPGVLEIVGIGYTGWFAYHNLVFKPDRDALIAKIKGIYGEIIGSSS